MNNPLPKLLQDLKKANLNYNIKLRFRKAISSGPYLLYLDIYNDNNRQTKSLGLSIIGNNKNKVRDGNLVKKALEIRQKYQSKFDAAPEHFSFADTDRSNFIEFFQQLTAKKSDKNYRLSYNKFLEFYKKEYINIKHIDYALCEDFKDFLINLKISDHTAKHYFTCFKGCLNYAVKRDLIDKNPAMEISIRYQRKSVERLDSDEVHRLWKTPCNYHDLKNGFIFSCYTGLRFSDIINLTFPDIRKNQIKVMQQKTLSEVEIPLHDIAQKILAFQSSKSSNEKVFHIPTGGKATNQLRQWMLDANICKHITFHCARHTFGCLLVEKGINLFVVKKLMGHRKIETTLQYVDKANIDAEAAISSLS
jgi:integrase/recombinase XerD